MIRMEVKTDVPVILLDLNLDEPYLFSHPPNPGLESLKIKFTQTITAVYDPGVR